MEWIEYEASLWPGCRQLRDESFVESNRDRYEAIALRCFACAPRDELMEKWRKDSGSDAHGIQFVVTEVDDR